MNQMLFSAQDNEKQLKRISQVKLSYLSLPVSNWMLYTLDFMLGVALFTIAYLASLSFLTCSTLT